MKQPKTSNVRVLWTRAAPMLLALGAALGCGDVARAATPARASTGAAAQPFANRPMAKRACDDPLPPPPAAQDCGATDTTPCQVASALTGQTFANLQMAVDASPDGDVLTVTGQCPSATILSRNNLTIQGQPPFGGCGFNGPSPTLLTGEVNGLDVAGSTNINVRFLNLVNSAVDGLAFVNSTTPLISCDCAAFNANDGIRLDGTNAAVISQTLDEANTTGIESSNTSTIIISNNTVNANSGDGIFVANAVGNNVSFNIVVNNVGNGIFFQNVRQSLATGNTIRNNGDGLTDLIVCQDSQAFGSNVPAGCMGF